MLELQRIRENKEEVIERLAVKNFDATDLVEEIIHLDQQRRTNQKTLDDTLARAKQLAKEIGRYFKSGEKEKAETIRKESLTLKEQAKVLSENADSIVAMLNAKLVELPNIPHSSVPRGKKIGRAHV